MIYHNEHHDEVSKMDMVVIYGITILSALAVWFFFSVD